MTALAESPRPDDDDYATPYEVTRALLSLERFAGGITEPFAGEGKIAAVLREAGYTVAASTIGVGRHEKAFPKHRVIGGIDALQMTELPHLNVVTNPPYGRLYDRVDREAAEKCIRHMLALGAVKACFYLNIKYLGGEGRGEGLFAAHPPARVWVASNRTTMYPRGWVGPMETTTETFAWFVWDGPARPGTGPVIGWFNSKNFMQKAEPK